MLLALVPSPDAYLVAWAFLGLAMRMTLYDAAFAALVQVTPSRGRRAISYLTLFGGFASSVFWPIGHALNSAYGWRTTLVIFAAINLLVCLPLHWFGLARRETEAQAEHASVADAAAAPAAPPLEGAPRAIAMALFSVIVAASAVVFGALAVHLVPILEASGLAAAAAVFIASLKGVAQVVGRIWDLTLARKWHPIDVGRVSVAFMPLSFLVLMLGGASFCHRAGLHLAVRHFQRARHHHARCRSPGSVRPQGLRRGSGHSRHAVPAAGGYRAGRIRTGGRTQRLQHGGSPAAGCGSVLVPRHGADGALVSPPRHLSASATLFRLPRPSAT